MVLVCLLFLLVFCILPFRFFILSRHNKIVSLKVKLLAMFGVVIPELGIFFYFLYVKNLINLILKEKNRWLFTPHNEEMKSESLLIAFGGGAMALMQIPHPVQLKKLLFFTQN